MGALHEGHLQLLKRCSSENEASVLSIFVNPKQFGPSEDFSKYPRTFQADLELAAQAGVTAVFAPNALEMYPPDFSTHVKVPGLSEVLCGAVRVGHFDGVCTVVLLLLNLAQADKAYFGMKDFQQLSIIRKMCADLAHSTQIVAVPTIREPDGLALSSRNRYLNTAEARSLAKAVPQCLGEAAQLFLGGERSRDILLNKAQSILQNAGLNPQYLELRDADHLSVAEPVLAKPAVLALAQLIPCEGTTCRLIDNVVLAEDEFHTQILADLVDRIQASR